VSDGQYCWSELSSCVFCVCFLTWKTFSFEKYLRLLLQIGRIHTVQEIVGLCVIVLLILSICLLKTTVSSRVSPIIGRQSISADYRYWLISTLVLADCRFCIVWTTCHWIKVYVCICVCHLLKHESGCRFRQKWVCFVTLIYRAFLFCLHSAVLQLSKSPRINSWSLNK